MAFQELLQYFYKRDFSKKETLLEMGQIACEIYFIEKGCIRLYYDKDGQDINAYFFTEGMFAGAYDSFITQKPSRHSLKCLEDGVMLYLPHEAFVRLLAEKPTLNGEVRQILEERFVALHDLFTAQILDSAEERYVQLMEQRPDLIARIPQHHLATFLGITPVSLSRIRGKLARG